MLVVDMTETVFCDSSGIQMLLAPPLPTLGMQDPPEKGPSGLATRDLGP